MNKQTYPEDLKSNLVEIAEEVNSIRRDLIKLKAINQPTQAWYNLKEACLMKGVKYNTAGSLRKFQPNGGIPDAIICGRKRWRKETILTWIEQSDDEIPKVKSA
jgi:hypothetical protein